jgi:leader peptidase (prepilin peptidase)/N-methyltransferase
MITPYELYQVFVAGLFGLAMGSFLNVCIYRLPRDQSLGGRSFCPHCDETIAWYDNIPLLSYVFLGGQCRHCGEPINPSYFLVELSAAVIVAASAVVWLIGESPDWVNFAVVSTFLLVALGTTVVDLQFSIIPNEFNYFLIITGLLMAGVPHYPYVSQSALAFNTGQFLTALFGGLLGGGLFLALALISPYIYGRPALGMGDVKLIAAYGLWLGPKLVLFTIIAGALIGAVVGTVLMAIRGESIRTEIPFGPYLCLAGALALLWGEPIIRWYLSLTRISV